MTDQERTELIALKVEAGAQLAAAPIDAYHLGAVDPRLEAYVREVADNPERHNVWEQLSVVHFLRKCRKYGLHAGEVLRFYTFYEALYFPGKNGPTRYKLTPVQCFQFASIYGFWRDGRRVVREAVLFVPRKFSKTTSSAAFAVYDLIAGEANAESYTGANSSDQAKKCFDIIRGAVRKLDPNEKRYVVNEQMIKSKREDRSAFAQCLTANARTKDGLNASTVIMDEFSQARDMNLLSVLTTSMGVRSNPLTVIITTASDVMDGPFYSMLQGYKDLLRGVYEDDSVFAHLFEPDVGDAENSPETWAKVQPHMGITVDPDFYRSEYDKAKRNGAEAMLAFRTKLLNVYAENEQRAWISATLARSVAKHIPLSQIRKGAIASIGVDLSVSRDLTALSLCVYGPAGSGTWHLHTEYFFPEGALEGHPNAKLFRAWAEHGHLHLLPGDVMDYRHIVEWILAKRQQFRLIGIGYDSYRSKDLVLMLESAGLKPILTPVSQSLGNFAPTVQDFEAALKTGKISINDNPINYYCFGNAVLVEDMYDNAKPMKRSANQKIDGVITKLMSFFIFRTFQH
jgi:phage terminase large subunit-like protein